MTTISIGLNGKKRKSLAETIGKQLGVEAVYQGAPSYAYEVGTVTVDRAGALSVSEQLEPAALEALLDALRDNGFAVGEKAPSPEQITLSEPVPPNTITIPLGSFNPDKLDNLLRLIDSKARLIRKALTATELPVAISGDTLNFPWFNRDLTPQETAAYTDFLTLLADQANRQARVIAVEREVENEKYAFRCFLLRIGMIGAPFTDSRRILLKNMVGNGSMKSGERKTPLPAPVSVAAAPPSVASPESEPATPEIPEPPGQAGLSVKSVITGVLSIFKIW